jgi:hypothetical protein
MLLREVKIGGGATTCHTPDASKYFLHHPWLPGQKIYSVK